MLVALFLLACAPPAVIDTDGCSLDEEMTFGDRYEVRGDEYPSDLRITLAPAREGSEDEPTRSSDLLRVGTPEHPYFSFGLARLDADCTWRIDANVDGDLVIEGTVRTDGDILQVDAEHFKLLDQIEVEDEVVCTYRVEES